MQKSLLKFFLVFQLIVLFSFENQLQAQQDAIYSQYLFNPLAINPAYAGSRNSMSAVILHRSQWVGIDGAPTTQTATIHAPINKHKIAWGFNLLHETIGPNRNVFAGATGAYHIKFRDSKLAFGIRAGVYNSTFYRGELNFKEDGDNLDVGGTVNSTVPSFDAGAYFYKTKFFAGFSATHIYNLPFNYDGYLNGGNMYLRTHLMFTTGYVFEVNPKLVFKPSIFLKSSNNAPVNLDLNFSFLLYKKMWLGLSFRNKSSVNFLFEFNIKDYLRMGYSYDLMINQIGNYTKGSHELFIGFDFDLKKSQIISPRYL